MRELYIDARRPQRRLDLRELWRYRDLFMVLTRRDIAVRYRQTILGILWAVLQPLITMLIFSVIFGRLASIKSDGIPYSLFAFAGLVPWMFFSSSLNAIGSSVINSSALITKVYFPRLIIPISAVGVPAVDMLISTTFMFVLMAYMGVWPTLNVLWLPVLFLLAALTAIGVGTLIAALSVAYRDFRNLLGPLTMFWLFLTPVIYPPTMVPEDWRWLLFLNPMAGIVEGIRSAFLGRPFDLDALAASCAVTAILLVIGVGYFRAVERRFADII